MICRNCHYSLEQLTAHRCPECGTAFDPNDPNTFDDLKAVRVSRAQGDALVLAMVWIAAIFVAPLTTLITGVDLGTATVGALIVICTVWCIMRIKNVRRLRHVTRK